MPADFVARVEEVPIMTDVPLIVDVLQVIYGRTSLLVQLFMLSAVFSGTLPCLRYGLLWRMDTNNGFRSFTSTRLTAHSSCKFCESHRMLLIAQHASRQRRVLLLYETFRAQCSANAEKNLTDSLPKNRLQRTSIHADSGCLHEARTSLGAEWLMFKDDVYSTTRQTTARSMRQRNTVTTRADRDESF